MVKRVFIRAAAVLLSLGIVFSSADYYCEKYDAHDKDDGHIFVNSELRGVWLPYFSMVTENYSEGEFKKRIDKVVSECKQYGINTLIVHTRPFGDSIYPSELFPMSHIISGKQGKSVDFDALDIIINTAHSNNISVHAWINPLRIKTSETPEELSEDNPYIKWKNDNNPENDNYTFTCDGGLYYDPSYSEVRKLIIDGVRELVQKYKVDGVQIDDYFYPSENVDYDKKSYESYKSRTEYPLPLIKWRQANISALVSGLRDAVHSGDEGIVFGIAPQCNIENNHSLGADVESWCGIYGYADYICPQIYVTDYNKAFPLKSLPTSGKVW